MFPNLNPTAPLPLFHPDFNFSRAPNCTLTLISPHWVTNIQHQHRCWLFFRPSTFFPYGRSVFSFWIVHFDPFGPSTSGLLDRLRSALMTVQFSCFRPSSVFLSDRPLFDFRTVHFESFEPSTLDRALQSICGNMFPIYEFCFQSKFTVSNLRTLFPI